MLLLDEPTAGLDVTSADRIADVVEGERAAGHTAIEATHNLGDVVRRDHVCWSPAGSSPTSHPSTVLVGRT